MSLHPVRATCLLLLAFALVLAAAPATADTLRLRTGKTLQVDRVEILERSVRVTLPRPEGVVKVDFPFKRLDAAAFLAGPHAKQLTEVQRKRLELLALVARQLLAREKVRAAKAKAEADEPEPEPDPPAPRPRPARARPDPEERPRPEPPTSTVPPPGSYAEERYRSRVPSRRAPPRPRVQPRPPIGGGASRGGVDVR